MNFFKKKFTSVSDDEGDSQMDEADGPPSSFSFQSIANRVSSTISAPTSPVRSAESLASALEKSLNHDRSRGRAMKDAKVILVIDSHHVDWSKYFRAAELNPICVEQGDVDEIDVMATEKELLVEIRQNGRDVRSFTPSAVFIGAGATRCAQLKTIVRSFLAAHVHFLNSPTSVIAFLDKNNLKKQLKKITLHDGAAIPMLPIVHYPHFHRFRPVPKYPVVISVNEGYQGIGKIKVGSEEELSDVQGMLQIMSKGDTEVEISPLVDVKYDLHVQKIGEEFKTFIRRGISKHWKSNVGSSVLEQIPTNDRHRNYIRAITDHVGHMEICSIDVLVSKAGKEYVHDVNDVIAYFGESAEDDRRAASGLMKLALNKEINAPASAVASTVASAITSPVHNVPEKLLNGHQHHQLPSQPTTSHHQPPPPHRRNPDNRQLPQPPRRSGSGSFEPIRMRHEPQTHAPPPPMPIPRAASRESISYVDDTMGQLKRTFAGFFSDGSQNQ